MEKNSEGKPQEDIAQEDMDNFLSIYLYFKNKNMKSEQNNLIKENFSPATYEELDVSNDCGNRQEEISREIHDKIQNEELICPNCLNQINQSNFCGFCGYRLKLNREIPELVDYDLGESTEKDVQPDEVLEPEEASQNNVIEDIEIKDKDILYQINDFITILSLTIGSSLILVSIILPIINMFNLINDKEIVLNSLYIVLNNVPIIPFSFNWLGTNRYYVICISMLVIGIDLAVLSIGLLRKNKRSHIIFMIIIFVSIVADMYNIIIVGIDNIIFTIFSFGINIGVILLSLKNHQLYTE